MSRREVLLLRAVNDPRSLLGGKETMFRFELICLPWKNSDDKPGSELSCRIKCTIDESSLINVIVLKTRQYGCEVRTFSEIAFILLPHMKEHDIGGLASSRRLAS